jgi:hypothetical protein
MTVHVEHLAAVAEEYGEGSSLYLSKIHVDCSQSWGATMKRNCTFSYAVVKMCVNCEHVKSRKYREIKQFNNF